VILNLLNISSTHKKKSVLYGPTQTNPFKSKVFLGGGGFKYFYFLPYLGKMSNFTGIFQMGWFNHHLGPDKIQTQMLNVWLFFTYMLA